MKLLPKTFSYQYGARATERTQNGNDFCELLHLLLLNHMPENMAGVMEA
ncbi:MAG: hypothetical protein P8Y67_04655 [Alphaproteobacteria bacterium]